MNRFGFLAPTTLLALVCAGCSGGGSEDSTSFNFTTDGGETTGEEAGDGDGDTTGDGDGDTGSGECGNGTVEGDEQCDLGPDNGEAEPCTPDCQIAACGDGYHRPETEECDDGNSENTDGCVEGCKLAVCGDGFVNEGVEACDDGNEDETDECTSECTPSSCGDGVVQEGEQCDDANDIDTDECPSTCQLAFCGDGFVLDEVEECDDGNMEDNDGCVNYCKVAYCGDGFVNEAVEECDDSNDIDTDACTAACTTAYCGDGIHWQGMEECDDGNMVDDDYCANDCTLDVQPSCAVTLLNAPNSPDGLYVIDPDGGGPVEPFEVFCDMTTDGGGWTLILNRVVDSDNLGQPDLDATLGTPDLPRATNWQFNIDLFWTDATEFAFADKENADCEGCTIADYDSAISMFKPGGAEWSRSCPGTSTQVDVIKLVGPLQGNGVAYQCADSLGWGSCAGNVCHYGTHTTNNASDGQWSYNGGNEMHFPSAYSNYKSYGNVDNPPSAWCRSCGGGLAETMNQSTTCCGASQYNARSRWTLWVR